MSSVPVGELARLKARSQTGAEDGWLGWVPAFAIGYAILFDPLLLMGQPASDSTPAGAATAASSSLNQIFWLVMLLTTLIAARHQLARIIRIFKRPMVVLLALYMTLALASLAWSPVPAIAFRRAALQIIVLATIILPVFLVEDRAAQIHRVMVAFFVAIALNVAAVVLLPAGRLGHQGIYTHKNEFGLVVAYGYIFCLYGVVRLKGSARLMALGLAAAALLELVVSQSKTSLGLALLIPVIALLVLAISRFLRVNALLPLVFGFLACLVIGVFVANLADFSFADFSLLLFDDTTFTGRTLIWDLLLDVIGRSPLLGQGYGSFWDIGPGSIILREGSGFVATLLQGHNGYIDVAVELGLPGLVLLVLLLLLILFSVGRAATDVQLRTSEIWLFLSILIVSLCHNMLETSWFRGFSVIWMLTLLVGAWSQAGKSQRSDKRSVHQDF